MSRPRRLAGEAPESTAPASVASPRARRTWGAGGAAAATTGAAAGAEGVGAGHLGRGLRGDAGGGAANAGEPSARAPARGGRAPRRTAPRLRSRELLGPLRRRPQRIERRAPHGRR